MIHDATTHSRCKKLKSNIYMYFKERKLYPIKATETNKLNS